MRPPLIDRSKDLVLVGGGHSHVIVIRNFGMHPSNDHQVTLISAGADSTYSGMLPGLIAGHYDYGEAHIDLTRLCQWAGVRFIKAEVIGLDSERKQLRLAGRAKVSYDIVSFDVGAEPDLISVDGASDFAIPVKPITKIWQRWTELQEMSLNLERIAVVGGGAGSVEIILAMVESLSAEDIRFDLYCGSSRLLPEYSRPLGASMLKTLRCKGVTVHLDAWVDRVREGSLVLKSGERHNFDEVFWCTAAAPTPWLANSGLSLDSHGFLATKDTLQSLNDEHVFAVGDCASQIYQPRPKAGIFAVRQGPVLARNLRAKLAGKSLHSYKPQKRFLSILSLGSQTAVAYWGRLFLSAKWVWSWKNLIDKRFMRSFEKLPDSKISFKLNFTMNYTEEILQLHCGGCGAKVSPKALSQVLTKLSAENPDYCMVSSEDAREITFPSQKVWQSIDGLRGLVGDLWQMGQLAANHALSDLFACGLQPHSAQALIVLPFATPVLQARELTQILEGALTVFKEANCILMGGHSMQGPELQIAFAVNGYLPGSSGHSLSKKGLQVGDKLLITRPLGSGILFAAHMQFLANGSHLDKALAIMTQSNFRAAEVSIQHGVKCVTDVTGFGLAVHLIEMLESSQGATVNVMDLPSFEGVLYYMSKDVRSTGHQSNKDAAAGYVSEIDRVGLKAELLFDPQTCGGLLMGVAPEELDDLSGALASSGVQSYVIGEVTNKAGLIELRL